MQNSVYFFCVFGYNRVEKYIRKKFYSRFCAKRLFSEGATMKKITAYTWAFILLIAAFFVGGLFTLGSPKTTGSTLTVASGSDAAACYSLSLDSGEKLDAVYVNVGAMHTTVGSDVTITVKTSTTSTGTPSWSTFGKAVTLGNIYGKDGASGANYNWVKYADGQSKSSIKKISFSASAYVELNEIVCLNTDGEIIELTPYTVGSSYTFDELSAAIDRQENFRRENGAYYNFTQDEAYYMSSVHNVLGGKKLYGDARYVLDGNFNYLATLLMTPSVAIFGDSVFAVRLPAFLATCVLIVFAYLLLRALTKSDKLSFFFAIALAVGGMTTTVGRLGAPYAMVASALVVSAYCMYRFFSRGISSKHIVRGGMPVFLSGTFAAIAMAMDITAVIPVVGILVLFGFGLRRQKLAYALALKKVGGENAVTTEENGEVVYANAAAERAHATYAQKTRISYGFAALSFGAVTLVLLLLSSVLIYSAYMKSVGNQATSFIVMLWRGVKASARETGVTSFASTNAMNVLGWWLPLKPATLYAGVTSAASGEYVAWNAFPNAAVSVACFLAFLGMTAKVVVDFVKKAKDKKSLRIRRTYFVLFGGMLAAMAAGMLRGNASAATGLLFHVLYVGFLPLAAMLLPEAETREERVLVDIVLWVAVALFVAAFVLNIPSMYGFVTTARRAKWFGWTSLWNNGFFRP